LFRYRFLYVKVVVLFDRFQNTLGKVNGMGTTNVADNRLDNNHAGIYERKKVWPRKKLTIPKVMVGRSRWEQNRRG